MCGAVRFEVTEPLVSARYCHCTRCQRRTGTAASVNATIVPGSLRVVSGEELIRAFESAVDDLEGRLAAVHALERLPRDREQG